MTVEILKIIAIISMTIDHIGFHLLEKTELYLSFRIIGRIAFPIFCFLIAEGFRHTRSRWKYLLRLSIFGVAIELVVVVFYFISGVNFILTANIFPLLAMGLLSLILLKDKRIYIKLLSILVFVPTIFISIGGYGLYGLVLILIFGLVNNRIIQTVLFCLANAFFINALPYIPFLDFIANDGMVMIQWYSICAMVPIFFYNGKLGHSRKYFFYIYYPAHLAVIIGLDFIISMF